MLWYLFHYLGLLWAFLFLALFLVLVNIFFVRCTGLGLFISLAFAMLYSFYLIIDTQLIMGGRKKEFRSDQYIMGAVMLYTDIVQLFITLLHLIGEQRHRFGNYT